MDGKQVGRAVRNDVHPMLREAGFSRFTGRRAWRYRDDSIEHIVFSSMNSYIAGGVGCTTYSFSVEAGVFHPCATGFGGPTDPGDPGDKPKEYHCTFRFILGKTLQQPFFHPYGEPGADRPDVWYVLPDGSNLAECVSDAGTAIETQAFPLLDRFAQPQEAYRALLTERSTDVAFGKAQVWMPGNPGSPHWRDVTEAIGARVGADAARDIQEAPVLRLAATPHTTPTSPSQP